MICRMHHTRYVAIETWVFRQEQSSTTLQRLEVPTKGPPPRGAFTAEMAIQDTLEPPRLDVRAFIPLVWYVSDAARKSGPLS